RRASDLVRGADVGEVRAGGLQVVVVAVHPHVDELVDLFLRQHAERARDLDVVAGVADRLDAVADLRHQSRVRAAHGRHDAGLRRARGRGLSGGLHQTGDVQPRRAHRCGEPARLRTEVTVLRTTAGLDADDALDLHLGTTPFHAHLVSKGQQFGDVF